MTNQELETETRKDFAFTVTTTSLPDKVSEVMRAAAVEKMFDVPRLRQYGLVEKLKEQGASYYFYYTYSDVGDADDIGQGADFVYDDADATENSVAISKFGKGFKISKEADHLSKLSLRAAQSKQCVQKVILKEDATIVTRLIAGTNNTYAASNAWSSADADPTQNMRRGKRLMKNDNYEADMVLLNPTNAEELTQIVAQNMWFNLTEKTVTSGILPFFMGLKIVEANSVTEGTAIILKSGSMGAFQVGEAMPITMNVFEDQDAHVIKVQSYERVGVAVVRPDAMCTVTGI